MKRRKKSESLEVRLPLEDKEAFMRLCQTRGKTASEMIRAYIIKETRTVRSHTFTHKGAITMSLLTTTFIGIAAFTLQIETVNVLESRALVDGVDVHQEAESQEREDLEVERAARLEEISRMRELEREAGASEYVPSQENFLQELREMESQLAERSSRDEASITDLHSDLSDIEARITTLEGQSDRTRIDEMRLMELRALQNSIINSIDDEG